MFMSEDNLRIGTLLIDQKHYAQAMPDAIQQKSWTSAK
jgi:hypothetical protein